MKHQIIRWIVILVSVLVVDSLSAQEYRAKLNSSNMVSYRASSVYLGLKGGVSLTALGYPQLKSEKHVPGFGEDMGVYMEWRFFDKMSVGLDILYSFRNTALRFSTPYLVSYTQTANTNITYSMSMDGIEFSVPITWYFGKPKPWLDSYSRYYAFVGPSFFLIRDGLLKWKRTHLIDGQILDSYQVPVSTSSSSPYSYGAKAGFGINYKQKVRHYFFTAKADISLYYGLSDTFSEAEKALTVSAFYGLGDIQHEKLGTRYFRQIKLSLAFAIPLRDKPAAACRDFGIY